MELRKTSDNESLDGVSCERAPLVSNGVPSAGENASSEGTVEASMAKWSRARAAIVGNLASLVAHHLSESSSSSIPLLLRYLSSSGNPLTRVSSSWLVVEIFEGLCSRAEHLLYLLDSGNLFPAVEAAVKARVKEGGQQGSGADVFFVLQELKNNGRVARLRHTIGPCCGYEQL